jgi:hypothetical protein
MLTRSLFAPITLAVALVAGGAGAGTLTSATWTTELSGLTPTNLPITVPVIATGTSTSSSVSVSLVLPAFEGSTFGTGGPFATYRHLSLGGSQLLTATPSMAAATMGVVGSASIKVAVHVAKGANASMLAPGKTTLVKVPLDVGVAGVVTDYFTVSGSPHYVTVDFYGWSPGMRTFTGLTSMFSPLPDAMVTGSFALTPMGGGNVLLVAPTRIAIDGPLGQRRAVTLSTLQLQFVPEPGALVLLVAGGLAVLLLARRTQP